MSLCTSLKSNIVIIANQTNLALCSFSLILYVVLSADASWVVVLLILCPAIMSFLSWVSFMIQRQRKLSTLYDMDQNVLKCKSESSLPPFLPKKLEDNTWYELRDKLSSEVQEKKGKSREQLKKKEQSKLTSCGWAMVTGASGGIGRALAVEIARYNIPVILVARSKAKLIELSIMLEECYGVATHVLVSDFSESNAAEQVFKSISEASLQVDILINNAGIGDTNDLVDMDCAKIQDIITVNSITVSKLCQLFGKKMKQRRRGRIVLISSITGVVSVPTASIYAASKAFQKSFAASIGLELEAYNVAVTCVMPGAVLDTKFATQSNMQNALIWKFPIGGLTTEIVASCAVNGMIAGSSEIVVGYLNVICVRYIFLLLPERIVSIVCRLAWN